MNRKYRIYLAGKLNSDACGYIKNLHRMIKAAEQVRRKGFCTFVPGLDFITGVVMGDMEYTDFFDNNSPWLDVSDAVFLVPGYKTSEGTKREIERAINQGIPVYASLDKMEQDFWGNYHERV